MFMRTGFSAETIPNTDKVLIFCALECLMEDMLQTVYQVATHSNIPVITPKLIIGGLKFSLLPPHAISSKLNTILDVACGEDEPAEEDVAAARPVFDKMIAVYQKHKSRLDASQHAAVTEAWAEGAPVNEHESISKPLVQAMLGDLFIQPDQDEEEDEEEEEDQEISEIITCACDLCSNFVAYSQVTDIESIIPKSPFARVALGTLARLQTTYG